MTLADRVEQASGPDLGIFAQAFFAVHGPRPSRVHGGSIELTTWLNKYNPFHTLVMAGGWIDAAMTLMPKGLRVEAVMQEYSGNWCAEFEAPNGHIYEGNASSEVLARLAAILRAHEQGGEGDE